MTPSAAFSLVVERGGGGRGSRPPPRYTTASYCVNPDATQPPRATDVTDRLLLTLTNNLPDIYHTRVSLISNYSQPYQLLH